MNWLCWHVGTHNDPKLGNVAKRCSVSRVVAVGIWAALLEIAASSKVRGDVSSADPDDIAFALEVEPETVSAVIAEMTRRGMIENQTVAKWSDRQHGKSTERVKRFRERRETDETLQTVSETDATPTGQDKTVHNITSVEVVATAPRKREPKAPLPRDWVADEIDIAFAVRMGLSPAEIAREQTKFAAYWTDGKGQGEQRTLRGWRSSWQRWISNVAERGSKGGQQHRTTGGNGFVELGRSLANGGTIGTGGGFDEAA